MADVHYLPSRLRVVEQAPAGRHFPPVEPEPVLEIIDNPARNAHGFPPVDPVERIEVTAGLTKVYATRVDGVIWAEFETATNAIRCAEHLRGLASINALSPQDVVRHMLAASIALLPPEPPTPPAAA